MADVDALFPPGVICGYLVGVMMTPVPHCLMRSERGQRHITLSRAHNRTFDTSTTFKPQAIVPHRARPIDPRWTCARVLDDSRYSSRIDSGLTWRPAHGPQPPHRMPCHAPVIDVGPLPTSTVPACRSHDRRAGMRNSPTDVCRLRTRMWSARWSTDATHATTWQMPTRLRAVENFSVREAKVRQ